MEQFSLEYAMVGSSMQIVDGFLMMNMTMLLISIKFMLSFCVYKDEFVFVLKDKFSSCQQKIFLFISNLTETLVKMKKTSFMLCLCMLFIWIVSFNILGLVPGVITVTSHFSYTLYLSLATFICSVIVGACFQKEKYFSLFLPSGVPVMIKPVLILMEFVSYISSIFSLSMRLFANMLAGHILLKILVSFIWIALLSSFAYWMIGILPLSGLFIIFLLETSMAFLQGYVFVVLFAIYLDGVVNMH